MDSTLACNLLFEWIQIQWDASETRWWEQSTPGCQRAHLQPRTGSSWLLTAPPPHPTFIFFPPTLFLCLILHKLTHGSFATDTRSNAVSLLDCTCFQACSTVTFYGISFKKKIIINMTSQKKAFLIFSCSPPKRPQFHLPPQCLGWKVRLAVDVCSLIMTQTEPRGPCTSYVSINDVWMRICINTQCVWTMSHNC